MSIHSPSARIYTAYDIENPPKHPGIEWTRFVCISDTHSRIVPVPPGDVLLHAGDLSSHGTMRNLEVTVNWLKALPHVYKIVIAGNHDCCLDRSLDIFPSEVYDAAHDLLTGEVARKAGIRYLQHQALEFIANGHAWKIYGSPATPRYGYGAFQYTTNEVAQDIYNLIPFDADILLTHTPPYGIHDISNQGNHAGCPILANQLHALQSNFNVEAKAWEPFRLRLHVWGHIHEARNASIASLPKGMACVQVNAAVRRHYPPIIVDLRHDNGSLAKV